MSYLPQTWEWDPTLADRSYGRSCWKIKRAGLSALSANSVERKEEKEEHSLKRIPTTILRASEAFSIPLVFFDGK